RRQRPWLDAQRGDQPAATPAGRCVRGLAGSARPLPRQRRAGPHAAAHGPRVRRLDPSGAARRWWIRQTGHRIDLSRPVMQPTFASRWERAVGSVPDRPFLIWDDGAGGTTVWTYSAFHDLVAEVAGWLLEAGVKPGDGVHLSLPNSPAFVAVWLASSRLGAWILPVDPQSTPHEIAQQVTIGRPRIGVGPAVAPSAYAAASGLLDGGAVVDPLDPDLGPIRSRPADWRTLPAPEPRDRAAVMFTSGTTSAPKGVVVTQANYAFAGDVMAAAAALVATHRHIVVLPMFHANAQYYSFASAVSAGA